MKLNGVPAKVSLFSGGKLPVRSRHLGRSILPPSFPQRPCQHVGRKFESISRGVPGLPVVASERGKLRLMPRRRISILADARCRDRTAMDCDLVEVSGQMDLPHPRNTPAFRSWTAPRRPSLDGPRRTLHCLIAPSGRVTLESPPDFQHRTPMDSRQDREGRRHGRTPGPCGTASRAKGVLPDDRSLETFADPLGAVRGGRLGRRHRHRHDARAALLLRAS